MNKIVVTAIVAFMTCSVNAQLSNTKWKGILDIDGGMDTLCKAMLHICARAGL